MTIEEIRVQPSDAERANGAHPVRLRVFLRGTWLESTNVGDNAIIAGLQRSLDHVCEFTALTGDPDRVVARHGIHAMRPFDRKRPWKLLGALGALRRADALFLTGGTPLYNDSKHMTLLALLVAWARMWRVPVVVFAVSLRPTDGLIPRLCVRLVGRVSSYWGVREFDSKKRSERLLPERAHRKIRILPDPAMQITGAESQPLRDFAEREGIPNDRRWVVVCPRWFGLQGDFGKHHYGRHHSSRELGDYVDILRELTEWLIHHWRYRVIFFPMHIHHPDDDRIVGSRVRESIEDSRVVDMIHVVQAQYDPVTAQAVLAHARYVVAVRFHSIVLASSSATPVISIGYDDKNDAFMEFMGLTRFAHRIKGLDRAEVRRSISELESDYESVRHLLSETAEAWRREYQGELRHIVRTLQASRKER